MKIKWLKLKNFRNYSECLVEFSDGINLISGKNGQGKTNLVEGVMINALTKSPRTSSDNDMKKEGSDISEAEVCLERNYGEVKLCCRISTELKKQFFINSNEVKKLSEVFGNLVAVYFSPADLKIVSGSPSDRRDFIDTDISQLSGSYYTLLNRYNKVLDQRNRLLKTVHNRAEIEEQIDIWNEQLASLAGHIIKTRKSFIKKLSSPASETIKFITNGADKLSISYVGANGENSEEIKSEILSSLQNNLSKDMELGYTTIGPHRDDIKFSLNGHDSRIFASQGQQRSIVLALKIAELETFEAELGEKPILVLDDVFSELDTFRQKSLYEKFKGVQVLMTGTLFKFKPDEDYLSLNVKEGSVKSKIMQKKKWWFFITFFNWK